MTREAALQMLDATVDRYVHAEARVEYGVLKMTDGNEIDLAAIVDALRGGDQHGAE